MAADAPWTWQLREVRIRPVQPVVPNGAEEVELERVVERLGLVLHPGRDVQDLALANRDLLAVDQEFSAPCST